MLTWAGAPAACLRILVSPSWTVRYTVWPTTGRGAATQNRSPERRARRGKKADRWGTPDREGPLRDPEKGSLPGRGREDHEDDPRQPRRRGGTAVDRDGVTSERRGGHEQ